MFRFFRTIRKNLLSENPSAKADRVGKVSRYTLYAIGEIFLVVIGILLALSINKWNENRVNLSKANIYLETILIDIVQDTLTVKLQLERELAREETFDRYFNYIIKGNIDLNHLEDTLRNFKTFTGFVEFTTTTYDQLVASGKFELIPEEKRFSIISYYKVSGLLTKIVDNMEQSMRNESAEARKYTDIYSSKYDFFESINHVPSKDFVARGLKHQHNRIELDLLKKDAIEQFSKVYFIVARETIEIIKQK